MSLLTPTSQVCSWTQALDNPCSLATYVANGGYQALRRIVTEKVSADAIIDVREADEYAAGHMPGAINIPRGLLEFKLSGTPALDQRNLSVVLYCKTSGRSALAAMSMQAMGYLDVVSMAGGFDAWVEAGLPVVKPALPRFD